MPNSKYGLKFTPKAADDLDEIFDYITARLFAETAAELLMDKIEDAFIRLKDFPFSCSFVFDEPLKSRGYRKLIIDNYIAFYLIDEFEKLVVIMRVLYGASNYINIL